MEIRIGSQEQDGMKMKRGGREYWVAVYDGVGIKQFRVTDRYAYTDGYVFQYENDHRVKDLVLVPRNYRFGEVDGKILIGKNLGNNSAAAMVGEYMIGRSVDPDAPGEDMSCLFRTHVAHIGYKTLYEKMVPWKWLIIGIAAIVVVFIVVWFMKSQGA